MPQSTKSLMDMGFGTAISCSYAVPEVGAAIGGALSGAQMIFDVFFPMPDNTDPFDTPPTQKDIDNALDGLLQQINDQAFSSDLNKQSSAALAENNNLAIYWKKFASGDIQPGEKMDDEDAQSEGWEQKCQNYFIVNGDATVKSLDTIMNWASGLSDISQRTKAYGLYAFAGGVLLNFCKLCLVWELNREVNKYLIKKAGYDKTYAIWSAAKKAWDANQVGDAPVLSATAPTLPFSDASALNLSKKQQARNKTKKDAFLMKSVGAAYLEQYGQPMVDYAAAESAEVKSNFDDRQAQVDTITAQFVKHNDGTNYWFTDKTGTESSHSLFEDVVDDQMEIAVDQATQPVWDQLTAQYGLQNVTPDDIATFPKIIGFWKSALLSTNLSDGLPATSQVNPVGN
jgi:hypothetical protein